MVPFVGRCGAVWFADAAGPTPVCFGSGANDETLTVELLPVWLGNVDVGAVLFAEPVTFAGVWVAVGDARVPFVERVETAAPWL